MDEFIPDGQWLAEKAELVLNRINEDVLTWNALVQGCIILFVLLAARVFGNRSAQWLKNKSESHPHKSLIRIYASYQEIFFLLYAVIGLWMAVLLAHGIALPYRLLHIVASLATAWAIIRFTSSTIESSFWSRLIAVTLWTIAALNILDLLNPAIEFMDNAAIDIGNFRLTLLLIFKSMLAFAALFWAIRFISGILNRSFRKAQGLTPSQRVLFYKLSNIILYAVGGIIGLNIVGLDLTALTVFSGALGLGIGFGLQKVFSNLISGIILLLDKSVKPGDVIAIGDTYGWVNTLGARCVSVLTRDGKEHLIPNENLITQEVENWSYSDQKIRVHIPVGVSYHSDILKVRDLLLQAVQEHPRILKHPKPNCLLIGFGDSSVDHELRVWIEDPAGGVSNLKSDIYYRIWELFQANDIEIPFPQRDVHMTMDEESSLVKALQTLLASRGTTGK